MEVHFQKLIKKMAKESNSIPFSHFRTPPNPKWNIHGIRLAGRHGFPRVSTDIRGWSPGNRGHHPTGFEEGQLHLCTGEEQVLPSVCCTCFALVQIGKWHLGHVNSMPTQRGFDEFYGLPYAQDEGCPPKCGTYVKEW